MQINLLKIIPGVLYSKENKAFKENKKGPEKFITFSNNINFNRTPCVNHINVLRLYS